MTNKKNNQKEDLSQASAAMRDESASKRERHNAAQDMVNRRWEIHYKQEAQKSRSNKSK